jgi:DNA-binding SARP family transcriptional activator
VIEPSGAALFRLLGPVEVWTGQEWAKVGASKQRSVLATLLLRPGEPVSIDTLIDEVWPDKPPAKATNLVSVYVHYLRQRIGDTDGRVLVTRAPGYQVVLGSGELDANQFAGLVADGRRALASGAPARAVDLLTEALGLWRGRALADVAATPLVAAEAGRLEESRVEALELRAQANLACGRQAEVVPEVRRLLADHPLREKLWALLIRALYGSGRQAEALEAYEQARTRISDELGVDPGADLRQLYQQMLNADGEQAVIPLALVDPGPPPAPVPAQLPADIPDFTGRAEQVDELRELLAGAGGDDSPGAVQVALVVGSGGLGKTALAVHAAHLLASQFPDGQLYANLLGATQPADPGEVLARFLRDMGMDGSRIPLDAEERAALYRTRLAGKRVLIVLDDARDAAQVVSLLPGSASCAVLVTTRNWLPELAGIAVLDLDVLSPDEGRALFTRVVGEKRVAAEPAATDEVLAACVGLPLAIRIAGARLATRGTWSVRTMADRLSDERRRLDELRVGNLAVRASFEVSFASLPRPETADGPDPAGAFRLLGLWTGPWIRLPAASALLGEPQSATADALDALVDVHLLESPEPDRYRFHDLLRFYAADRARTQESEPDRTAAIGRILAWYLHTAEAAATIISEQHARVPLGALPAGVQPLSFASLDDALAWCEAERAGLAAATRLAASSGMHEIAWKLPAAAMSFYYRRRSHWGDWVATHQTGLESARVLGDRQAQAWMLNHLGIAYGLQHMPEAVGCFEQVLDLSGVDGERGARAAANVAQAYVDLRRFDDAWSAAQRSLVIQRQQGNRYLEGVTQGILGRASRELGRFTEAVGHLELAIAIFREVGQQYGEADSLTDLADALLCLDQVDTAIARLQESLAICRKIGDMHGEAATLRLLGLALGRAGDHGQARGRLTESLRLFEELGEQAQAAAVRNDLAALPGQA